MGYHIADIPRGVYGEVSKVVEEALEARDAKEQGCEVMVIVELADLYGAISGYLQQHHPTITMSDLANMSAVTRRAFTDGTRTSR
jgi:phosphoribosyl-ATP pyrophosphohydrolase